MYLTYDDVWSTFLDNYKINYEDVAQTEEAIYNDIRNAVMMYNNRLRTEFVCDDTSETIIGASTYDDRLLIANYIKLAYLINNKNLYETLYQPIVSDVSLRDNKNQMRELEYSIRRQEDVIEKLIFNTRGGFL